MTKRIKRQPNLEKAIDYALWLNFGSRTKNKSFGVIGSIEGDYLIVETDHPTFEGETFETLPNDYGNMSYNHIKHISMDVDPISHWEKN